MKSHLLLPLFAMAFSLAAHAQDETPSVSSQKTKSSSYKDTLATPSLFFSGLNFLSSSQNFLAPQSGTQIELGLQATQFKMNYTFPNSKFNSELNDQMLTADIATAINENLFFELNFNYRDMNSTGESKSSTGTNKYDGKATGASDPIVSINGRINGSRISTILGVGFGIGTGDREYESKDNGTSTQNNKLGGSSIIPRLSIFTNDKDSNIYGLSTSYTILQDRESSDKDSDGRTSKETHSDGNTWTLSTFIETPESHVNFGGSLNYIRSEESTTKTENGKYKNSPMSLASAGLYLQVKIGNTFALIPSLTYGQFIEGAENLDKDSYIVSTGVQARASF